MTKKEIEIEKFLDKYYDAYENKKRKDYDLGGYSDTPEGTFDWKSKHKQP